MTELARVLIVEDEPDLADNLLELLAEFGVTGEVTSSAEGALERLAQSAFNGVLTDYRLPGLNGVELIREMRQRRIGTPVVLMSGCLDRHTTDEAEAAGALDVLCKPVDLGRLAEDVDEFKSPCLAVLVVEDNEELAENLMEALRVGGLSAEYVGTAAAAMALRKLPQVAIVDLRLPDDDGIAVARRLALRDPRVRIVFVSGYTERYREQLLALAGEVRQLDPDALWMEKPCDVNQLVRQVSLEANRG